MKNYFGAEEYRQETIEADFYNTYGIDYREFQAMRDLREEENENCQPLIIEFI